MLVLRDQASSRQSTVTLKNLHGVNHENQLAHNLKKLSQIVRRNFSPSTGELFSWRKTAKEVWKDYAQDKNTCAKWTTYLSKKRWIPLAHCVQRKWLLKFYVKLSTGGPSSSCKMIILRSNSHGGIMRVCMGIFTTALRNKTIRQILNKNISPYFHSVSLGIWPLPLVKRTHFSELSISRFSTYMGKAQGWTLHFRTLDLRSEKFQRKMTGRNSRVAEDPTTRNASFYVTKVSQKWNCIEVR